MARREYIIAGHVARLLTDDDLVINRGTANGVREDMIFDVIDPRSVDIKDPITGEDLGSLNRIKAKVRVVEVGERASMARVYPERGTALTETARIVAGLPKTSRLTGGVWPEGVQEGDPVGFNGMGVPRRPRTISEQAGEQPPRRPSE